MQFSATRTFKKKTQTKVFGMDLCSFFVLWINGCIDFLYNDNYCLPEFVVYLRETRWESISNIQLLSIEYLFLNNTSFVVNYLK